MCRHLPKGYINLINCCFKCIFIHNFYSIKIFKSAFAQSISNNLHQKEAKSPLRCEIKPFASYDNPVKYRSINTLAKCLFCRTYHITTALLITRPALLCFPTPSIRVNHATIPDSTVDTLGGLRPSG